MNNNHHIHAYRKEMVMAGFVLLILVIVGLNLLCCGDSLLEGHVRGSHRNRIEVTRCTLCEEEKFLYDFRRQRLNSNLTLNQCKSCIKKTKKLTENEIIRMRNPESE